MTIADRLAKEFLNKQAEYDVLAEWFDTLYPRVEDLTYYRERVAELGCPVLELGCGTGRVTCSLAEHGAEIIGLDLSQEQLRYANKRKATLSNEVSARIEFRHGSMTDFSFPERFHLIMVPFSALLELPTSQDRTATYRNCVAQLAPGGKLIFDNFYRGTGALATWGKPRPANTVTFWGIHPHPSKEGTQVHHFEVQEYGTEGAMLLYIFLDEVNRDGMVSRKTFQVTRQYASPEDTERELRDAGFHRIEIYGSFERHAIGDPSVTGRGRIVCEAAV